jgi:diguanylate cyclase (GGDEF)-like protein
MISIRKFSSDTDKCRQERDIILDCYVAAVRNTANYLVEFDDTLSAAQRNYLNALADEIARAGPEALPESSTTLRGLLRDYRDNGAQYLTDLREQIATTARALTEIVESFSQDGDHTVQIRAALQSLDDAAQSAAGAPLRPLLSSVAASIQKNLDEIRRQQQATIAQFRVEIQMLHQRIDTLETAVAVDALTKLFTRREMEERIRSAPRPGFTLLLIKVTGFRQAQLNFSPEVGTELISAFSRRLRNSLPETAVIGRWAEEEFIAMTRLPRAEAVVFATHMAGQLAGAYTCLQEGKTVRLALQLRVGVVDSGADTPDRILQRVAEVLTGKPSAVHPTYRA